MAKIHSISTTRYFSNGIVDYIEVVAETATGDSITWNSGADLTWNSTDPISFHGVEGV